MKKAIILGRSCILFTLSLSLFSTSIHAKNSDSNSESDYYIFAYGLSSNLNRNVSYFTDLSGNINILPKNHMKNVSYCVFKEHISSIGVDAIGGSGLIIRQLVEKNSKNEFSMSFEPCRSGSPTDFLVMQKNIADGIYNDGQWKFLVNPNYGLLITVPKQDITSAAAIYQNLVRSEVDNERAMSDRLTRLAASNGREKVYSITLFREHFVSSDEGFTCTINYAGQDAIIINSANHVIVNKINNSKHNKDNNIIQRIRFSSIYKDINDLWSHVRDGAFPKFSAQSGGRDCNTYIDFANNIRTLSTALDRRQIDYIIREYDSNTVTASANGFDTMEKYQIAQKIGVDSREMSLLESSGINTYEEYQILIEEMKSSGYSNSNSVYDLISYIRDKSEGGAINKSATFIKQSREQRQRDANSRANAEQERCLTRNGYYKTSNAAARSMIAKKR
jgi:hypothetical protein